MRVLFSVKHTGALAKTRIAMTALCSRLLRSGDDALTSLPQRWLDEVAESTQCVPDKISGIECDVPPVYRTPSSPSSWPNPRTSLERRWPTRCRDSSTSHPDARVLRILLSPRHAA